MKKTLLACGVPDGVSEDATLLRRVGKFFGYEEHLLDFSSILVDVVQDGDGGLHGSPLLVAVDRACSRKTRCDKLAGNPVFSLIWHELTTAHKGQRKKRKMLREKEIVSVNGKLRAVSVFVTHQERFMEDTVEEMHEAMLCLPVYLQFRKEYMALNPRLPADWQVCVVVALAVTLTLTQTLTAHRLESRACERRDVFVWARRPNAVVVAHLTLRCLTTSRHCSCGVRPNITAAAVAIAPAGVVAMTTRC